MSGSTHRNFDMTALRTLLVALALAPAAASACSELLQNAYRPLAGKEKVELCSLFEGKVLLVVNTASKCGFTPQYEALEALQAKYADQGFAVVGFPSNDFMNQEPGSEQQIQEFCTLTYGVKFPMFEKVHVKGDEATPIYVQMAAQAGGQFPTWNFYKYLVDRDGKVVQAFPSKVKPDAPELVAQIERLIATPAPAPGSAP
jgi:glutathione peroxidase